MGSRSELLEEVRGGGYVGLPTAGAVPVKNDKGQIVMKKVKVQRYIAGQRPAYAEGGSSDSDSDAEDRRRRRRRKGDKLEVFEKPSSSGGARASRSKGTAGRREVRADDDIGAEAEANDDRRYRRLQHYRRHLPDDPDERVAQHRQVVEPEIVSRGGRGGGDSDVGSGDEDAGRARRRRSPSSSEHSDQEDELSDEELDRRRAILRQRAKTRQKEEELLAREDAADEGDEGESSEDEESSDYDEYTDSEDDTQARLKPVFVRKRDRITLQETLKEEERLKQLQIEQKQQTEEKKKQSQRLVEEIVKKEIDMESRPKEDHLDLASVNTDDEKEEVAYEQWKIRELKRLKRDREEKDTREREKAELDRIRNMTEEERRIWAKANPKLITNKQEKGKYKFLQKYYHRGVFFLDDEEDVYKQNFAQPTLEDHFDKSILPKVMQVKDFGKAGRTKWTHLVSEDTTDFNSAWSSDTAQTLQWHNKHAAGVKEVFDRPPVKKVKK